MSRDLYLSFSNNTLITADNTTDFLVTEHYFMSSGLNGASYGDSQYYQYSNSGYDVVYSAGTQNYMNWGFGLFENDHPELSNSYVLTNAQLRAPGGKLQTINCGCGLVEVTCNSGPCNTIAYGEVVAVAPDQDGEAYVHHDLTQVTTVDNNQNPVLPTIVVKAFNGNYPSTAASGDTVTATLHITGVTFVTGGTSNTETTTYIDTMIVTHPGWGTLNSPEISMTYDVLPTSGHGIHRGFWQFELHVSTNNSNPGHTSNKYARAYMLNWTCPS